MDKDEISLIQKITFSDEEAFKVLFFKYQPLLFKFIYFKTNNYNLSQDIVQETFVRVWFKRTTLKPQWSFFSYLSKISGNLLKDHFKHIRVQDKNKEFVQQINSSLNDNPEQALDFNILLEQIHTVANKYLSETDRAIFFLSRFEGKSNREIADLLNIQKKKVENHIYSALKMLQKKLKKTTYTISSILFLNH